MKRREFLQKGLVLGAATVPVTAFGESSGLLNCNDTTDNQSIQTIIESIASHKAVVLSQNSGIAVAFQWDGSSDAPTLMAKGNYSLGRLIWKTAIEQDIPIFRRCWLADYLYTETEIGAPLPFVTWRSVVEILVVNTGKKGKTKRSFREIAKECLLIDPIEINLGTDLIPLAASNKGGDLIDRLQPFRNEIASDIGFILPRMRVRDSFTLDRTEYEFCVDGQSIAKGYVFPNRYFALDGGKVTGEIQGIETIDPVYGTPALWVDESVKEHAQIHGYTVVEPNAVIMTHLSEAIRKHACDILTTDMTQDLLDVLRETSPVVVNEVQIWLDVWQIHKVLQLLLKEQIPIKRLETILEALLEQGRQTKDPMVLYEHVRQRLTVLGNKTAT